MVRKFIKALSDQIAKDDAFGLAAQCAYYFLLSLFPFLIFIVSLLGFMPFSSDELIEFSKQYIPRGVAVGLESQLREIVDIKRSASLSFGLLFSLFTASAAMNAIVNAVNRAYGLPDRKSYIHSRLLAILLTLGMLIVVASALLLSVFSHSIGDWLAAHTFVPIDKIKLWNVLSWIINFAILFCVFLGLYFIAPNTCLRCKEVLPGAILASIGWQVTSLGFSYYVNHWGNYNATYGSLGGVIVLLTWFYLCAFIIIVCGEINAMSYLLKNRKE
ncbi:YihY/virulence factor BrkB family protein [Paenibacillus cremeus]|uniref:YihY/virulence factor BrkB family protein n=1 Tax=Paenibacillus cremeus TaxID=2163881 RepID=A0A559KEH1_9BACL|nr:YihY/virulence factor BrkB family protein [Paenibacillus cremeus]TVY10521.1 YihY/virulence factor BrkB family protein [Paenibacillus cremeus]